MPAKPPMVSGIYEIRNRQNGHFYIGSAVNFRRRWNMHLHHLRRGIHHSQYLQNAWRKYGAEAFEFRIIGTCPPEKLLIIEQHMLDQLRPTYNISPTAGSTLGLKPTAETRRKIGEANRGKTPWLGRKHTEEKRGKISIARKGKRPSQETRQKMSLARKGRPRSEEAVQKTAAAHTGMKRSEAARRRMSEARSGKRFGPLSAEHIIKLKEIARSRRKDPITGRYLPVSERSQ